MRCDEHRLRAGFSVGEADAQAAMRPGAGNRVTGLGAAKGRGASVMRNSGTDSASSLIDVYHLCLRISTSLMQGMCAPKNGVPMESGKQDRPKTIALNVIHLCDRYQ